MCGFVGCVHDRITEITGADKETFRQMNSMITHRGQMMKDTSQMITCSLVSAV